MVTKASRSWNNQGCGLMLLSIPSPILWLLCLLLNHQKRLVRVPLLITTILQPILVPTLHHLVDLQNRLAVNLMEVGRALNQLAANLEAEYWELRLLLLAELL
jgi:hypothetical protein